MAALEYTAEERAHDIAMMARSREVRARLWSIPKTLSSAPVVPATIGASSAPRENPPRHYLDMVRYEIPLFRPANADAPLLNVPNVSAAGIISEVAAIAGVNVADIKSELRFQSLVRPRQFAMWRVRQQFPYRSLPEIGRIFGGRDHTTVMHGISRVNRLITEGVIDPENPASWVKFRGAKD